MNHQKPKADNFAETLKKDPEEIIKWCEAEIKCYYDLIKIIKINVKNAKQGL